MVSDGGGWNATGNVLPHIEMLLPVLLTSAIYTHNEAANTAQSRTVTVLTGIWLEGSWYGTRS